MSDRALTLELMSARYAVCRLPPDAALPSWASGGELVSVTRTEHELSIVAPDDQVPPNVEANRPWAGYRIAGVLDFSEIGIISEITQVLSKALIPVFVVSTFETDYIFVPWPHASGAAEELSRAGYSIERS